MSTPVPGSAGSESFAPKLTELLGRVVDGHETTVERLVDGRDSTIKFSLQRQLPPEPRALVRAETPARDHVFYEATSFAAYLARYGADGDVVVFADPSTETCWARLEESASDGVETLKLTPQLHPLWKPWSAIVGSPMPLKDFRSFLDSNRRAVHTPNGKSLALKLAQLRAAVEVTIHDGRGKNALNGILVKTNIQGVENKEVVEIPEELLLKLPLYVGGKIQDVILDLVVDADAAGNVTVMIAAGGVAEARVFAFDSMLAAIREGTKSKDATVTYGQPRAAAWSYLAEPKV